MKVVIIKKKAFIGLILLFTLATVFLLFQRNYHPHTTKMVMGGFISIQSFDDEDEKPITINKDVETYFRPSDLPVLNNRYVYSSTRFFNQYFQKKPSEIVLPKELFESPEETIINYFSVLRDAANWEPGKNAGCGTLGQSTTPYPVAYNFLTTSYQKKVSYEQYLASFKNILHTSLIKYREVPIYDNPSGILRYFVEIETIGGSDKNVANFTYYYGFVDLIKENNQYKISNLEFTGEDYLCAPYHGWSYDAEGSVEVRYGGWCKLIKEQYPTIQNGYIKHIYFAGTDGNDYLIEFFHLTNDTDIEIAQYRKNKDNDWKLIQLDPEKCIKDNTR
ncbi:MAG: hypothetical protein K0S01_924 [Herbinix sp.]|jgi:hypothetical protein|nr:hypothetical protein [Herbinix sp.]